MLSNTAEECIHTHQHPNAKKEVWNVEVDTQTLTFQSPDASCEGQSDSLRVVFCSSSTSRSAKAEADGKVLPLDCTQWKAGRRSRQIYMSFL